MFDLFSCCKSTTIDLKLLEKEEIDHFDIETILCISNLNKVIPSDLQKLKECIVLMKSNEISCSTMQGVVFNISSKSSIEVWDILFSCMKNSPSNIQCDSCCQMNVFSNVFSDDELKLLPQSWFTIFLSDMCYLHNNVYPETPETSRILLNMFSKLSTVVPEIITDVATLHSLIEVGIKKFSKLGTPFWACRYFGNIRYQWLRYILNDITSKEATMAFECIVKSMQWNQITYSDTDNFFNLSFQEVRHNPRPLLVKEQEHKCVRGIEISVNILEYLFKNLDQELIQLPYIYALIYKTNIQFKANFCNSYNSKPWRYLIAMRLRDFIEMEVKRENQSHQFVYAVCALYFIWYRGDAIHFSDSNAYDGSSVKDYIKKYRPPTPTTLFYEGSNLIASMY